LAVAWVTADGAAPLWSGADSRDKRGEHQSGAVRRQDPRDC